MAPVYAKGDKVWVYRKWDVRSKRAKVWVAATVKESRMVMADGYYVVDLQNGVRLEAYDQTIASRREDTLKDTTPALSEDAAFKKLFQVLTKT